MKIIALSGIFALLAGSALAQQQPIPIQNLPQASLPLSPTDLTMVGQNNILRKAMLSDLLGGGGVPGAFTTLSASSTLTLTGIGNSNTLGSIFKNDVSFPYPSTGTGDRPHYWSMNLTNPAGTSAGNEESFFTQVKLNGPGTMTGEINIVHPYFENEVDSIIGPSGFGEAFEASGLNYGTINGSWTSLLGIFHNASTGTMNLAQGIKLQLTNDNTSVGSVSNYVAIDLEAPGGPGSAPTSNVAIRQADPNASIVSVGGLALGQLGAPNPGTLLFINGTDSSDSTFPFNIKNRAGENLFFISNAGTAVYSKGVLDLGSAGSNWAKLNLSNLTSGNIQLSPPATGALGNVTVTIPAVTDTLVALAAPQTLSNKTLWGASFLFGTTADTLAIAGCSISGVSFCVNAVTIASNRISTEGGNSLNIQSGAGATFLNDAQVNMGAGQNNYFQFFGGAGDISFRAQGSSTDIGITETAKGGGKFTFANGNGQVAEFFASSPSEVNNLRVFAATAGNPVLIGTNLGNLSIGSAGGTTTLSDATVNANSVAATSYAASGHSGVSCAAGTVDLATLVVTNGIVTHC